MTDDTRSPSSASACTRGASGAATSSSTAWPPPSDALADAGLELDRHPVRLRRRHHPQRLPRLRRRRHLRPGPRLDRRPRVERLRRLRLGRHGRSTTPGRRSWPACATWRWWSAPTPRPRASSPRSAATARDDPDWLRFHLLGATNPPTSPCTPAAAWISSAPPSEDFAQVKVKNARHGLANPNARYRKEVTVDEVLGSPDGGRPAAPARDLRHLRRRRRLVLTSMEFARAPALGRLRSPLVTHRRRLDGHADVPEHGHRDAELRHRLGRRRSPAARASAFRHVDRRRRLRGGRASAPTTSTWPRSTTCRRPSSSTGTRTSASAARARPRSCCATATPPSAAGSRSTPAAACPASARPSRPRPSPRCASSRGSSGAGRAAARSRGPGSASPPTRACSATARRSIVSR